MPSAYSMRRAAYQAVRGWAERQWRIETSISRIIESNGLQHRDVAAARDIAATTIKRVASIDAVLRAYCKRPRGRVEDELWTIAQVGVSQLLFRQDLPAHAVVHETVGVADEIRKPQWKPFLNGLLRGIVREIEFRNEISLVECLRTVATQSQEESAWAMFGQPISDGGPSNAEWLSSAYSFPRWLMRRWLDEHAGKSGIDKLLRASNAPPKTWLRINPLKQSTQDFLATAQSIGESNITFQSGPLSEAVVVDGPFAVSELPGFADGSCSVQDLTAMKAVDLLGPQPGEAILDLCSAPGGKACHIAERMQGQGRVLATDIADSRLERVRENIDRLRLTNIEARLIDPDEILTSETFDAALIDVPCSNTGVLSKRPEARWRISESDLEELPVKQQDLLRKAAATIRPGGRLVYSTCSIEQEENTAVAAAFVAAHPEWSLSEQHLELPSPDHDGGYRALLQRAN